MDEFILSSTERMQVFRALCENRRLRFNSILRITGIRSNKLSYQLNMMKEKGFIDNKDGWYSLSADSERLIPYLSQIMKSEAGVLPVVLGIVRHKKKILLIRRKKMPYIHLWGLFGGKQISGETIPDTIMREVFEESGIIARFRAINGIIYERIREEDKFKHSFLLIVTTLVADSVDAEEKNEGQVMWFDYDDVISGNMGDIIPSDIEILKKYSGNQIEIEHIVLEEKDGSFSME